MKKLLAAIVTDDAKTVAALLKTDPSLALQTIREEKLYNAGVFHWIYVGDTALHLAAAGHRAELVSLLLKAGADPNAAGNRRKSTPLHYASDGYITGPAWDEKKQLETLRRLMAAGADIHARDMNGATPLHRAVRTRCAAAVNYFLKAGADPLAENKPGSTAFQLAVQNTGRGGSGEAAAIEAQREIIRMFLSSGADPDRKNSSGKSVRDCVRSEWIGELLR